MLTQASDAATFVSNLRLLNLDKHDDWPSITAQLLSAKDAQQNQKKRIQCVEWALYRLFELWDPGETRNKLRPFFPPLAPLQSLNLRAALFRCLNDLKKNGVLGREVTVRKTMLDECKGEKVEEVLLSFSTIVLHKVLAAEDDQNHPIAKRLALAPKLKPEEQKSLLPLAIAHKASLTAILHRKEQLRSRYLDFQRSLEEKDGKLRQQHEHLKRNKEANTGLEFPERSLRKIRERFDTHWPGDPRWLDMLLDGDVEHDHDPLLEVPFDEAWRRVLDGTLSAVQTNAKQDGLLRNLENRVAAQQARLQHWKQVRDKLAKDTNSSASATTGKEVSNPVQNLSFDFSQHKAINLQQGETVPNTPDLDLSEDAPAVLSGDDEYTRLLKSMQRELDEIDAPRQRAPILTQRKPGTKEYQRPLSNILDTPFPGARRSRHGKSNQGSLLGNQRSLRRSQPERQSDEIRPYVSQPDNDATSKVSITTPKVATPEPKRMKSDPEDEEQYHQTHLTGTALDATEESIGENDEDSVLAAQIIAATMNAGPSPVKNKPSLIERTRRSMALASPGEAYHSPSEEIHQRASPEESSPAPLSKAAEDVKATLLERTRQSMSLLPTQPRHPRQSTHKHRHSKQFPVNQFETPGKQQAIPEDLEEMTPPEKVFSEDADYASVFKSRPKIAMSPAGSPAPEGNPGRGVLVGNLGDDDNSGHWDSSPPARR